MANSTATPHPKTVGDRTSAAVLARLTRIYDGVLVPFGDNQRFDLVVEDGRNFLRIQCKTGRLRQGAIRFNTCNFSYHHPKNRKRAEYSMQDYRGAADYFGVYCPDTNGVYLAPVEAVGIRQGCLRVGQPRNGQSKRIRWARDYELTAERAPFWRAEPLPLARGNST